MYQATIGQVIKAKDFGNMEFDYIIGEVTATSSDGSIEGTITTRVMDNKDVTGEYDDGYFNTVQNGSSLMDDVFGARITLLGHLDI